MRRACLPALFALALASAGRAELPSVRLDRIAPLGAAAGSTVEIDAAAADADGVDALLFDHPGLKAEHVGGLKFRVTVAADVPAGTYDLRLVGKSGVSNPRLFAVSRGPAEVAEKGPNDEPTKAMPVAINTVVNSTSDGGKEDFFRVPLKAGQRVVVEVFAQRLDSLLDATLALTDADGRPLAANGDYFGRDPLVDVVAPRDGEYLVSVHDLSYRGGQPYRLLITDRPRVENVFPRAFQAGKATPLAVFGRNLPAGKPSPWKVNDQPLDEAADTFNAPADLLTTGAYRFLEHPTAHSVMPTAATCTLVGTTFRPAGTDDAVPVLVTDGPVTLEAEPNDDPKSPQSIALPAVVSGRFDKERDADWYEFTATEDGAYAFDVYSERIAGRADPYLVVMDDKDNRVSELDDAGARVNAFDGHLRDPAGTVNLSKGRKYRVLVQDRYRRGGARYQYVLTVRKPVPDFFAAAIHHQNPGPGGATVPRGGAVHLDIVLHPREGFNGPVTITADGLPKGVQVAPTIITESRGVLVLRADPDAADWAGTVRLMATARRGEETFRREVRPYTRVWSQQDLATSRPTRELALAVRGPAPFALRFAAERLEVDAGGKIEAKLLLTRGWPDFTAVVNVIPLSLPNTIKMSTITIAPDKTEATVTFEVAAGAKPGDYTLAVTGQGQVPYVKDAKTGKTNTLSSQPSWPITLVVRPASKK